MKRTLFAVVMACLLVTGAPAKAATLRYATQHPVDHVAQAAAEAIKAEVEEKTQGRVKITIYPANQLGDWTQVFDEVMMGTIDIAHTTVPEAYDPRIAAGFLPYLARDYDELSKVFAHDAYLPKVMEEIMAAQGLKFLGYFCEGFIGIGLTKPANEPANPNVDKGVLCRVPGNDAFKLPVEYLGYRTSTLPYADVFAALQTGVVDGWSGGPPNLNYLNYRDLIKHYYQYNVNHEALQMYMNADVFASLSADDQQVLLEAFRKQSIKSLESAKADEDKYIALLREAGIEVTVFTEEELATMAKSIREVVWPKLADSYGKDFLDELLKSLE